MANTFDCEPFLRALEEQADSIGGAATGLLQAMETFKENAASMVRTVENLKKDDRNDHESDGFSARG